MQNITYIDIHKLKNYSFNKQAYIISRVLIAANHGEGKRQTIKHSKQKAYKRLFLGRLRIDFFDQRTDDSRIFIDHAILLDTLGSCPVRLPIPKNDAQLTELLWFLADFNSDWGFKVSNEYDVDNFKYSYKKKEG
jgi:hypothetical protein